MTRAAPCSRAIWTARLRTPPAAAVTATVSPARTRAADTTTCQAVRPCTSAARAVRSSTPLGIGTVSSSRTTAYSGYPPIPVGNRPTTRTPSLTRRPATSNPGMIGNSCAGNRQPRSRRPRSVKFTPALLTWTSVSPFPGDGRGTSVIFSTSGPPSDCTTMARITAPYRRARADAGDQATASAPGRHGEESSPAAGSRRSPTSGARSSRSGSFRASEASSAAAVRQRTRRQQSGGKAEAHPAERPAFTGYAGAEGALAVVDNHDERALKTAVSSTVPAAGVDSVRAEVEAGVIPGAIAFQRAPSLRRGRAGLRCLPPRRSLHSRPRAQGERPPRSAPAVELVGSCAEEVDHIGGAMKRVGHYAAV